MTTWQDAQIGLAKESAYGTAVTVTRFFDYINDSLDYKKGVVQSRAIRGGKAPRTDLRCTYTENAGGDIELEPLTKGAGLWWEMLMGTGVSTKIGATTVYQQLFTLADEMPSYTIQKGIPRVAGSTVDPFTFKGCVASEWTARFGNTDPLTASVTVDGREVTTATGLASASYPTGASLFCFAGASLYSGSITAPTTTELGAGNATLASVQSGSLSVKHNLQGSRPLGGGGLKGKPTPGMRDITASLEVDYDATTWTTALLGDSTVGLVVTYEGATIETTYKYTVQFVLPFLKVESELPKPNGGEVIRQRVSLSGAWDLSATQPLYVVCRTTDTAL